jgi:hypothetical protein
MKNVHSHLKHLTHTHLLPLCSNHLQHHSSFTTQYKADSYVIPLRHSLRARFRFRFGGLSHPLPRNRNLIGQSPGIVEFVQEDFTELSLHHQQRSKHMLRASIEKPHTLMPSPLPNSLSSSTFSNSSTVFTAQLLLLMPVFCLAPKNSSIF